MSYYGLNVRAILILVTAILPAALFSELFGLDKVMVWVIFASSFDFTLRYHIHRSTGLDYFRSYVLSDKGAVFICVPIWMVLPVFYMSPQGLLPKGEKLIEYNRELITKDELIDRERMEKKKLFEKKKSERLRSDKKKQQEKVASNSKEKEEKWDIKYRRDTPLSKKESKFIQQVYAQEQKKLSNELEKMEQELDKRIAEYKNKKIPSLHSSKPKGKKFVIHEGKWITLQQYQSIQKEQGLVEHKGKWIKRSKVVTKMQKSRKKITQKFIRRISEELHISYEDVMLVWAIRVMSFYKEEYRDKYNKLQASLERLNQKQIEKVTQYIEKSSHRKTCKKFRISSKGFSQLKKFLEKKKIFWIEGSWYYKEGDIYSEIDHSYEYLDVVDSLYKK